MKINVSLGRKLGTANYGSLSASCAVAFEAEAGLLQHDLEGFYRQVRSVYAACRQAVEEELARQQQQPAASNSTATQRQALGDASAPCAAADGSTSQTPAGNSGRRNGPNGHQASEKQADYIKQLARQISGLGVPDSQRRIWDFRCSPTRLNLWIRCPLAFPLCYIDGIKTPTTPGLFIGTAVHRGLEVFYRHRQLGILLEAADVTRRMLECWAPLVDEEDMRFESTTDEQAAQHQATELVAAYIRQLPADEPRPLAVEAAVEAPLVDPATGEDLGIPLVGIMDLVLGGSGGPTIIDHKTSARSSEPLEIIHEVQLTSYVYLFRRAWPQSESGLEIRSLIKTKVPKIEVHRHPPRTEAHFRRLFSAIREYLDAIDRNRLSYRPGFGCAMCEHRETHCRAWCG